MLNHDDEQRYNRQIILPLIGRAGQERLLKSRVLVIGAGGLGAPLLSYLAAAGVGTLGVVDGDRVERSNLGRQILFETGDIGRPKVHSAEDRVYDLNPGVQVITHPVMLDASNAEWFIAEYDLVADGCDDFATRLLVNATCHRLKKPLVSAALRGFEGQISSFLSYLGAPHPCYQCWVHSPPPHAQNCAAQGVVGALAGVMGSLQAMEVIKLLLGIGESLDGVLLRYDALQHYFTRSRLVRDPACPVCA